MIWLFQSRYSTCYRCFRNFSIKYSYCCTFLATFRNIYNTILDKYTWYIPVFINLQSIGLRSVFRACQTCVTNAFFFCKNSKRLKAVNYFYKKLHLRYLAGFWMRFCRPETLLESYSFKECFSRSCYVDFSWFLISHIKIRLLLWSEIPDMPLHQYHRFHNFFKKPLILTYCQYKSPLPKFILNIFFL